jgi:hypothetical protein
MENKMFQDLRYAARMLLKHKSFTAVAALTLALGIGANTAIFSVIDAVLIRSLPFADEDRLVVIYQSHPDMPQIGPSFLDYQDWREKNNKLFVCFVIFVFFVISL